MNGRCAYFNGRIVPESQARLSIYDSALLMGDMAYEVTRTFHGRAFRLRRHLERLFHTLLALRIDPGLSVEEFEQVSLDVLARNLSTESDDVDWNLIQNVSRGPAAAFADAFSTAEQRPTVVVSCFPLTVKLAALSSSYATGIDLVTPAQRAIPSALIDSSLKTRSRLHFQLANMQAADVMPGAHAVLVDPDGYLTEGTSANLFVVRGGELHSPAERNMLPGISREFVLELAERLAIVHRTCDLTPQDAEASDEVLMTSTSIGILHARSFNGRAIGTGALGPIGERLGRAMEREVGVSFAEQASRYAARRHS